MDSVSQRIQTRCEGRACGVQERERFAESGFALRPPRTASALGSTLQLHAGGVQETMQTVNIAERCTHFFSLSRSSWREKKYKVNEKRTFLSLLSLFSSEERERKEGMYSFDTKQNRYLVDPASIICLS